MEKKKKKLGLLPKLLIAIVLGLVIGTICQKIGDAGELIIQIGATYNSIFGNFLNFCIPLIIIGFVVPGIADLGTGAGKTLAATTGVAYLSTIIAGSLAFVVDMALFPSLVHADMFMADAQNTVSAGSAYCSMVKHVFLLLFTFGIWYYIWIYRTTCYLNQVEDEPPRNPTAKLLLCMFVPFYSIYWIYKSAQRLDKLSVSRGIPSDLSTLCLILAIFVGVIPPILMQDRINALETGAGDAQPCAAPQYAAPQYSAPQYTAPRQRTPGFDVADELKKYKDLLDCGAITQEEFDAKKKQLLGL